MNNSIIPSNATNISLFDIKDNQAYIGFTIPNSNFHFINIPIDLPKDNADIHYLQLLRDIKRNGTLKPAARENMPGTISLFGYQLKHDLSLGFPLLTTKKMGFKGMVVELLWFLKGDTNIKFLDENGVDYMWHQDAYAYYEKLASKNTDSSWNTIYMRVSNTLNKRDVHPNETEGYSMFTFEEFCSIIRINSLVELKEHYSCHGYTLGDCGYQYGKVWRSWGTEIPYGEATSSLDMGIDQIKNVLNSLKNNPESRRHIVTAVDPAHDQDLALYWCHSMFQFNCRPLTIEERISKFLDIYKGDDVLFNDEEHKLEVCDSNNIPKYYLDCQMYQRSADVFLGVPYNIASYALLTEILAKICNMIPGTYVHTFGDVHIYQNHIDAVNIQLERNVRPLPTLRFNESELARKKEMFDDITLLENLEISDFILEGYNPNDKIFGELSTGIKK